MFDDTIVSLNEIAKVRASLANNVGGVGSQFKSNVAEVPISVATASIHTLNTTSFHVTAGSSSYISGFNHGSGQFSVAAIPFYDGGTTQTQFCVRPYTVNQTNGSITLGSATTIWTNGSGNCNSTTTWGQAGPYIFNTGNHCAPGNGGNVPITTVAFVNNNSVQGTQNTHGTFQPNQNDHSFCTWDGSTAYWAPGVYNQNNNSWAARYAWSSTSNGTSLSNTGTTNFNTDTSSTRSFPVIRQFGTNGPNGSLQTFRGTSNGPWSFAILNSTAGLSTTVSVSSFGHHDGSTPRAMGLELSNGRQLFYFTNGSIILRDGNTLTNVTDTADYIPFGVASVDTHFSTTTPIATNTWIVGSNVGGVAQMVKFSVNPTTYKITIAGSYPLANKLPGSRELDQALRMGCFVTGNNNQFLVLVTNGLTDTPKAVIRVFTNPLSGVS